MRFRDILATAAAATMMFAPVAASAANPAAKLSVSASARASADNSGSSKLLGIGGWIPVVLLSVVAVVSIVVLTDGDNSPNSP